MELSKRAKDMLDNCIAAPDGKPFTVSKVGWVKMLTLLHELAIELEHKTEVFVRNKKTGEWERSKTFEATMEINENKNLGDKRPISRTESAVRKEGIRDEVVEAVESSSGDERRSTDSGKRS